jgi:molybdopterin-guanine dinucleotide biosynthesis protein A
MGRPKAWLRFGDERMLQRVVRLAGTVADPMVVVAAPGQDLPDLPPEIMVVRDTVAGRGPLQGLAAGLAALPQSVEVAYVTATDVPFLEPRWISRLTELIEDFDIVIPHVEGYLHPLAALYRRAVVLPAVGRLLGETRLGPVSLVEMLKARVADEAEIRAVDPELGILRNLNCPEDYRAALDHAGFPHDETDQ